MSDFIAIMTMDNQPVNAQGADWDIQGTFDLFGDRDDVRVAILTGAGSGAGARTSTRSSIARRR